MPRHRYRPPQNRRSTSLARLAGAATLAGAAAVAVAGPATAATPDLVPDLAPLLTAPDDGGPAPAPTAPYVEPSATAFAQGDLLNQARDLAPAGVPAAGLTQSAVGAPTRLLPS